MFSIFSRAATYANLTPGERAFMRFCAVILWGALAAGAQAVSPLLSSMDPTTIPWASVAHTFLAAFVIAVGMTVSKYHSALGDPSLPYPSPPASAPTAPAAPTPAVAAPVAPPASSLAVAVPAAASSAGPSGSAPSAPAAG